MNKELAIKILSGETLGTNEQTEEAVKMAVEALSAQQWIPDACRYCSNHPSNGGSGICHCTLGSIRWT